MSIFKSDGRKFLRVKTKDIANAGDFYAILSDNKGKNAILKIYEVSGSGLPERGNLPVDVVLNLMDAGKELEDIVYADHGSGTYQLTLQNSSRYPIANYLINIQRGKSKKDDEAKGQSSPYPNINAFISQLMPLMTPLFTMFEKLFEKVMSGNGGGSNQSIIDAIKLGQESSMPKEIIYSLLNNAMGSGGDPLETYERINNLVRSNMPTVENDGMSQLVGIITSLAGISALKNPVNLYQQQQQPIPLANSPNPLPPGISAKPEPGLFSEVRTNTVPVSPKEPEKEQVKPKEITKHEIFFTAFVKPFMEAIEKQESAHKLAVMMDQMLQYTVAIMSDDPHPLARPFLESQNVEQLNAAYEQFAASIPNLANKPGLKNQIKLELVQIFAETGIDEEPVNTNSDIKEDVINGEIGVNEENS